MTKVCEATCGDASHSACSGGCCDGSNCQPGNTVAACGPAGGSCSPCSGTTPICSSGACSAWKLVAGFTGQPVGDGIIIPNTSPITPLPVYVLTVSDRVQTSADGGNTWGGYNNGLPATFPGVSIGYNQFLAASNNVIVSGAESIGSPHVFTITTNATTPTWTGLDARIPPGTGRDFELYSARFQMMVGHMATGNDNGVGGTGGAFVNTHQGTSAWVSHPVGTATGTGRVIAGTSATLLYVAVNGTKPDGSAGTGGIFSSVDKGVTWTEIDSGIDSTSVNQIWTMAVDPTTPMTLWAGIAGAGRIYKSTNGGTAWAQPATLPGDATVQVFCLAIHPTNGTVYAGTSNGVYKTVDGGMTWTLSGFAGSTVRALAIDPVTPTTVYGGINASPGLIVTNTGG
jgi:hypothetical protein